MAEAGTKLPCGKGTIVAESHVRPLHFMHLALAQVPEFSFRSFSASLGIQAGWFCSRVKCRTPLN